MKKIPISRIAAEAGVSLATVSRVLNRRPGVSPELEKAVQTAIRKHGGDPAEQCRSASGGRRLRHGAIALLLLAEPLEEIRDFLTQLADGGQLPAELFAPLVKTVGVALVSRTGSDLCRDAGEGAMASLVETAGAVIAILVSLPLFQAAWDMLRSLL